MTAVSTGTAATCPSCGAERIAGATFCEACAFEFTDVGPQGGSATGAPARGEESPLDVGWTGPVDSDSTATSGAPEPSEPTTGDGAPCRQCSDGHYLDGYCDTCGSKQPDPRDHFTEEPSAWVAGVCDIGKRHRRNEDAMALSAEAAPGSFATIVVCDGVSNSTDSHIASLAASRAAREVLATPLPHGVGTRTALVAAAERRLADAVAAADQAVEATTEAAGDAAVDSPPSCTFVAVVLSDGTAVAGNVGDSRAYWLPDNPESAAIQLSEDDSFAAAQMSAGVPRKEAETSAGAHAITRWLGVDSPDDLTPHTRDVDLTEDGWVLLCSDGLWNYCSDAADLQRLVHETSTRLGDVGRHPPALAQALTDFANESGGIDNITVALARVGDTHTVDTPETKDTP
ncbi:MAG TPA: PP2C family serine/threonine-protein phosphatase [Lapillicoccus sp.]|nr:PP2C family serine/threonine-protein phosphatase [Lapillicoccus sp.]